MSSHHAQDHAVLAGGKLRLAFLLTTAILAVELAGGIVAHSLALLADAGHVLTDILALGLAWFAVAQSRRPADSRRTYGYHRAGILAALVNAGVLILVVGWIAFEAVNRLRSPQPVRGGVMIAAALVALAVNAYIALSLRDERHDLNVRAALLHVAGDLAAAAAAAAAGLLILLTGWYPIDPLLSLAVAGLIAFGGVGVIRSTIHILLEGTPAGIDLASVRGEIQDYPGVVSMHDLHVWSLSAQDSALSVHLVVADTRLAEAEATVRGLEGRLCDRFGIGHTTIQLESELTCAEDLDHRPGRHNHPHPASPGRGAGH